MEDNLHLDKITFYFKMGKSLESIPEKNRDFSENEINQAKFSDHIIMDGGKHYGSRIAKSVKDKNYGIILKIEYFGYYPHVSEY